MSDDISGIESVEPDSAPVANQAPESRPEPSHPAPSSPWDGFKTLPQFQGQDDRTIATSLYQSMQREQAATRQLQQYVSVMPIAQEYMSNRPEYEKWKAAQLQQQKAASAAQEETKKWWNPPAIKDSYKRYLIKDEQGRDAIHPDAPMDARQALIDYQNYRADFAQKFLSNPEEALGPMIAEMAQKQAQEIIEKQLEARDNESYVANFEEENADWLYDKHENGERSVSFAGVAFHKYVEEARARGYAPGRDRAEYAVRQVELELLRQKYEQEQSRPPVQQQVRMPEPGPAPVQQQPQAQPDMARQNMEYLRREASRNPSRSSGATNNDPRQPKPKRTFEQMLMDEASSKSLI
jgi:hypothetical protein